VNLRKILAVSRDRGRLDLVQFAQVVFNSEDRLDALALKTTNASKVANLASRQAYVDSAVAVLARALELNPDELLVLRWFYHERLQDFGLLTPAEMISRGQTDAVLKYFESLDSGGVATPIDR
jgi:hypothetical protein